MQLTDLKQWGYMKQGATNGGVKLQTLAPFPDAKIKRGAFPNPLV